MKLFYYITVTVFIFWTTGLLAQWAMPAGTEWDQDEVIPSVFLIGQNEATYEKLMTDHSTMLLSVCENDMNMAYSKWVDVLIQMEAYSKKSNFDLNGVKLWINVFWNKNGSIRHIVFHPKPNSINLRVEELSDFFQGFINVYKNNLSSSNKFSHYGSAAFPTFPQRIKR